MATGPIMPILLLTGISFGNDWYNTRQPDLKILLGGAVAAGVLSLIDNIPGMTPVTTGIAWLAFTGAMVVPGALGNPKAPSPAQNLLKIVGGK